MLEGQRDYKDRAHLYFTDTSVDLSGGSPEDRAMARVDVLEFVQGLLSRWDGVVVQENGHKATLEFVHI